MLFGYFLTIHWQFSKLKKGSFGTFMSSIYGLTAVSSHFIKFMLIYVIVCCPQVQGRKNISFVY